jgi:hypothetical protein
MARERDIPVLLVIFPVTRKSWAEHPYADLHQQVLNVAEEKGLYTIDLFNYFSQHPPEDLRVTPKDNHPSAFGHELAARVIYQWMSVNNDLLDFSLSHRKKR